DSGEPAGTGGEPPGTAGPEGEGGEVAIRVRPITEVDLPAVAGFLHTYLNRRIPPQVWEQSVRVPWKVDAPDHGRFLADGGEIVGAYLAFYSERVIDGRPERFCNLGAWCVRP